MAITTLDSMISGLQKPIDFVSGLTGTMVAGRPVDLSCIGTGLNEWYGGIVIYDMSASNPTIVKIYNATQPFTAGQEISISKASATGSHVMDGTHTIDSISWNGAYSWWELSIAVNSPSNAGGRGIISSRDITSNPGSGGLEGDALTSFPGQIPFSNPAAGNTYLARLEAQCAVGGTLLLCDRLFMTCGINPYYTFTQVFPTADRIPARDVNAANNGAGVLAALVVLGAGNGSNTNVGAATLTYTDQDGNTGATSSLLLSPVAVMPTGTVLPFSLAGGDTGIRQVESLDLTVFDTVATWGETRSLGLMLYRILARLPLTANTRGVIDALTGCFPRLFDNTAPFLMFVPQTTTSSYVMGMLQYAQG